MVVSYGYDELGRLTSKTYGTGANAITETCDYNIRGWLTEKSSDVFDMRLRYYDPQQPDTAPSYTGNITEWEWQHKGSGSDNTPNSYAFTYDQLSRLTDSQLFQHSNDQWQRSGSFEEWLGAGDVDAYDKNGNILSLMRSSATGSIMDGFRYEYNGNQLAKLYLDWDNDSDFVTYAYDANGNCTVDGLNALKLEYNYLNLTSGVSDMSDSPLATYTWLADGTKIGVRNSAGTSGYEYVGSLIYKYVNGGLELESTGFGGGRIMASEGSSGTVYTPNYYITDHLGSTRAIYDDSANIARSDFMPFGTRWNNSQAPTSRYQFTGYEDQEFVDNKYMDAGARFYNGMRFNSPDPLTEIRPWESPYIYCGNNPIKNVDPTGLAWFYYSLNGYDDPTWNWRDEDEYHTGVYDSNNNEVVLQGYNTVVVFAGSRNERLGDGNNIDGTGAITANVTVYGSGGRNDVQTFKGYTMTSDADAYGPIDEGMYNGNYDALGKSGSLKSNWVLENRGNVRMMDGAINPNAPDQIDANGEGYKTGIFIHATNSNGGAGGRVSTGCLLIAPGDWQGFNNAMGGVTDFRVQIIREVNPWLSPSKGTYIRGRGPYYFPSTKIIKTD